MVAVIANEQQKNEIIENSSIESQSVAWITAAEIQNGISIYIDLLFDNPVERIKQLNKIPADCIIINHVLGNPNELPPHFVCFNGWPSFLSRTVVECAATNQPLKLLVEKVFALIGKKVLFTAGQPGFISARVIAMIINEAYLAVEEGVSTKKEIDTAMKNGTSYPYGPFEWATIIGLKKIHQLLTVMAAENKRYIPCTLLTKEAEVI